MKTLIDTGEKFKDRFATRYPPLQASDIPENPQTKPIDYRKEEIKSYHVIFWHRLLRTIYGEPPEIEYDLCATNERVPSPRTGTIVLRKNGKTGTWEASVSQELSLKLDAGEVRPFFALPVNWRYYVLLPTGGVIALGTTDRHMVFCLASISGNDDSGENETVETEKFVRVLLEEANRVKEQLFKPLKEFEGDSKLRLYSVNNVYLENYVSGTYMLDMAETEESNLTSEWLKYDARTDDFFDKEKKRTADQFGMARGMFYFSAISYFFMALEGFVNIAFHAFLKKDLRDRSLNLDQRLDLEEKLKLMTSLCHGFNEDAQLFPTVYDMFKKLKNYRNSLFHSKIEDSLKTLFFIEDRFQYNYIIDIDDRKERFLPSLKGRLTVDHVTEAKRVVDEIVNGILNSMKQDTRTLAEKYILNENIIPFVRSETGDLSIGIWREEGEEK